jgi:hypothetical protein
VIKHRATAIAQTTHFLSVTRIGILLDGTGTDTQHLTPLGASGFGEKARDSALHRIADDGGQENGFPDSTCGTFCPVWG